MPESPRALPEPTPVGMPAYLLARLPQRLRRSLGALSLVGAVLVALPVVQLLRYQSAELHALAAAQAGLDPVARSVQLQRGLLAHRDLAGLVLRGQEKLEPERRLRRAAVDESLGALAVSLSGGHWEQAIGEADALRDDWTQLAREVQARSVDAPTSDKAHGLLVEQTLQVIDLVADAAGPQTERSSALRGGREADDHGATLAVVHAMPRLLWQTAALAAREDARDPGARGRQMAAMEAALARTLGRLDATLHPQSGVAGSSTLAEAGAAAGATTERYFALLRRIDGGDAMGSETLAAGQAASQAQMQLFDIAQGAADATLAAQKRDAMLRSASLLSGVAVLALVALFIVLRLQRGLGMLHAAVRADAAPAAEGAQPGDRLQARELLHRLREGDEAPALSTRASFSTSIEPAPAPPPASR